MATTRIPLEKNSSTANESLEQLSRLMHPVVPSEVFITYWNFAVKRQQIFSRRLAGLASPWTDDPILLEYRFTNPYRVTDRVSQYLLTNVQYNGSWSPQNLFFRTLLFKLFNRITTWERLLQQLGEPDWNGFSISACNSLLEDEISKGNRIYSAAYIMPTGGAGTKFKRKHFMHLDLLQRMMRERLPEKLAEAKGMEDAFHLLLIYPTIGPFLAYQFVTDINYSTLTNFNEMEFVIAGPGAKEGIAKCFKDTASKSNEWIIRKVCDIQQDAFADLGLTFERLHRRPLQLIDCQNLFCEVAKYSRIYHPDYTSLNGRSRIKQKFSPQSAPIRCFYPPKWNLD